MKQSLQLRMGQSLTMTPQLQQAIRLLQLSTLDLQVEIQQALDSNPMLETEEDVANRDDKPSSDAEAGNQEHAAGDEPAVTQTAVEERPVDEALTDIPAELPVDGNWEDTFDTMPLTTAPSSSASSHDGPDFENQSGAGETLQEHLLWQMRLTQFTERDMLIAEVLIDAIDEQGYLRATLEEIRDAIQPDAEVGGALIDSTVDRIELDEIEAVLHRLHTFDPIGVGARDLRECLLVQLYHLDAQTPCLAQARELIGEHIELLGGRDFNQLMRRMKLSEGELRDVILLVQSLNPRPGSQVASQAAEYIVPDVTVRKVNNVWRVELNSDTMPRLRINAGYAGLVRRADNSSDNTYMRNQLQEARWFIKSLQSRNETLLKVATCIVKHQREFLEHGDEAMKALVLHDVADAIEMHESTVSRVTTKKYMHTPRGIFELKYFFSSHVTTSTGGECSATAIRALIKKMVSQEDPRKPLSDNKLAKILGDQGINVARRTIAKYRESIGVLSSSERKRLI